MDNVIGKQKSDFYFSRYWKTKKIESIKNKANELPKQKLWIFFFLTEVF